MKQVVNKKTPILMVLVLTSAVIPLSLQVAGFNLSVGKVISVWARVTGTVGCFYNPTLMTDLSILGNQLFCSEPQNQVEKDSCKGQIACASTQKKVVPFDEIADPAMPKPKPKGPDKEKGGQIADPGETKPKATDQSDDEEAFITIGSVFIPVQTPRRVMRKKIAPPMTMAMEQKLEPPTWTAFDEAKTVELIKVVAVEPAFKFAIATYQPELIKRTKELTNCNFPAIKVAAELERLRAGKINLKVNPRKVNKAEETEFETTSQTEDEF
jgi:hypothetical protein